MFNNIILKINILSFMTGIPVIPGVLLSSRVSFLSSRAEPRDLSSIFFVIPSGAEGSVYSFYRFLHSLCSVEMTEKVLSGRNDREGSVRSK